MESATDCPIQSLILYPSTALTRPLQGPFAETISCPLDAPSHDVITSKAGRAVQEGDSEAAGLNAPADSFVRLSIVMRRLLTSMTIFPPRCAHAYVRGTS